jgi:cytochrome c peroxidase
VNRRHAAPLKYALRVAEMDEARGEETTMRDRFGVVELAPVCAAICLAVAGCSGAGGFLCGDNGCGWSDVDLTRVEALSGMATAAPADPSNRYATDPGAVALGKSLYFDTRFSGPSTLLDALNRSMPFGRAPAGQNSGVACISCHSVGRGSVDAASIPGDVSIGAGWTYNNSLATFDSAFYDLHLWNGRIDSLWAQAVADNENVLTTNGNRLHTAWQISDLYAAAYQAEFTDNPFLPSGPSSATQAIVGADGQCTLAAGVCPTGCRSVTSTTTGNPGCWPQFPLQGKPGKVAGCQSGDASEPFGDAYDCMAPADQTAITQILVNFGKAIAAYEGTLISGPSSFDRWVTDLAAGQGVSSTQISDQAKVGAQLFVGKAGCSDCHNTPLLSDDQFHNVGVAQTGAGVPTEGDCPAGSVCDCAPVSSTHPSGPKNCLPWGARDGIQKLQANGFRRDSKWSDDTTDVAPTAKYVTADLSTIPQGAYRTPSLRNVSLTAPYMHDGSIATLADVVWHYSQGIADQDTPGAPAASFKPLYLSDDEQAALVAFLESLVCDLPPADVLAPPTLP